MAREKLRSWLLPFMILLNALGCTSAFLPMNATISNLDSGDFSTLNPNLLPRQAKRLLRIMPVGASITAGVGSTPEDGYRKELRTLLRFAGFQVNMVGSQ